MKKEKAKLMKWNAWVLIAAMVLQSMSPAFAYSAWAENAGGLEAAGIGESLGEDAQDEAMRAGERAAEEGAASESVSGDETTVLDLADPNVAAEAPDEEAEDEAELMPELAVSENNLSHGQAYLNGTGIELSAAQLALWKRLEEVGDGILQGKYVNASGISFDVPAVIGGGLNNQTFEEAMVLFHYAHPEYFFYDGYAYRQQHNGYAVTMRIRPDLKVPAVLKAQWESIKKKLNSYLYGAAPLMTDYEKAQFLYDALAKSAKYAYDKNGKPDETPPSHNIDGILLYDEGVCEGFALTYSLLLNSCGIPNVVAVGQGYMEGGEELYNLDHVWNIVQMGEDANTYLCDATWDEEATDKAQWKYFLIGMDTDEKMPHKHIPARDQDETRTNYEILKKNCQYAYSKTDYKAPALAQDTLYTMKLEKPEGASVEIRQGRLELPVAEDGSFSVYSKAKLSVVASYGERLVSATIDGTAIDMGSFDPQNGKTLVVSFTEDEYVSVTKQYDFALVEYGQTAIGKADILTKSGRELKGLSVSYVRNDGRLEDELTNAGFSSKAWYDKDAFAASGLDNFNKTVYYDGTIALPDGIKTEDDDTEVFGLFESAEQPGRSFSIYIDNLAGGAIKAYRKDEEYVSQDPDEPDRMIEVAHLSKVAADTVVTLKVLTPNGEAQAKFYSQIKNEQGEWGEKKVIKTGLYGTDATVFMPMADTKITAEITGTLDWNLKSLKESEIAESYEISAGTSARMLGYTLPQRITINSTNGLTKTAKISWDLKAYKTDMSDQELTVNGTVTLPEDVNNPNKVPLKVQTTVKIKKAITIDKLMEEFPTTVTAPYGTKLDAQALALPRTVTGHYAITTYFESPTGETDSHTDEFTTTLQVKWTADEANQKMHAVIYKDGFVVTDSERDVDVKFESGITDEDLLPANAGLEFKDANSKATSTVNAYGASTLYGTLSFEAPDGTDRRVEVLIPRGFNSVIVSNAAAIENVGKVGVDENEDKSETLYLELDDAMAKGTEVIVTFTFNSTFHSTSSISDSCKDDLGMLYERNTKAYFPVIYQSGKDASLKRTNILPDCGLTVKVGNEKSFANYFTDYRTVKVDYSGGGFSPNIPIIKSIKAGSPYFVSFTSVVPFPSIVKSAYGSHGSAADKGQFRYSEGGNQSNFNSGGQPSSLSITPTITLQDNITSETYTAQDPIYFVGYDNFGNEYVQKTTENFALQVNVVQNAELLFEDTMGDNESAPEVANPFWVKPKDSAFLGVISRSPGMWFSDNTVQKVLKDVTYTVEIPDGIHFNEFGVDFGSSDDLPRDLTFVYDDGTSETIAYESFTKCDVRSTAVKEPRVELNSDKTADSAYKRGEKRIRKIIAYFEQVHVSIYGKKYVSKWGETFLLQARAECYDTYSNGNPVLFMDGNDNPVVLTGAIRVEAGGKVYETTADYYLCDYAYKSMFLSFDYGSNEFEAYKKYDYKNTGFQGNNFKMKYKIKQQGGGTDMDETNLKLVITPREDMIANAYINLLGFTLDGVDTDKMVIRYTDGTSETVDAKSGKKEVTFAEGKDVKCFEFYWDHSDNVPQQGDVVFDLFIDWDKVVEEEGKIKQYKDIMDYQISADHDPGKDLKELSLVLSFQEGLEAGRNLEYKETVYTNPDAKAITLGTDLKRDEAIVRWNLRAMKLQDMIYKEGAEKRLHFDRVKIRMEVDKDILVANDEKLKLTYELDGETITKMPVSVTYSGATNNLCDVVFEDLYNDFTLDVPVVANTFQNGTGKLAAYMTEAAFSEDQPYLEPQAVKLGFADEITFALKYMTPVYTDIKVLVAASDQCYSYGASSRDKSKFDQTYRIAAGEEASFTVGCMTTSNMAVEEMVVWIPKAGDKLTGADGVTMENQINMIFTQIAGDGTPVENFYTTDGKNWISFGNKTTAQPGDGVDLSTILGVKRVWTSPVSANRNITFKFKTNDDDAVGKVGCIMGECTYVNLNTNEKTVRKTNLATYQVIRAKKLEASVDSLSLGQVVTGEMIGKNTRQFDIISKGLEIVPGKDIDVQITGENADLFTVVSDYEGNTLNGVYFSTPTSSSKEFVKLVKDAPVGSYTADYVLTYVADNGKIETITVPLSVTVIAKADFVAPPTADPDKGEFKKETSVTLSTDTEGAQIYYTMTDDGSEPKTPDANAQKYTQALKLAGKAGESVTIRIKAIAAKEGGLKSDVSEFSYVLTYPKGKTEQVKPPVADLDSGSYKTDKKLTLTTDTEGAKIYYTITTDGSEPETPMVNSTLYKEPIALSGKAGESVTIRIKAIAVKEGMRDSKIVTNRYVINLPKEEDPEKPSVSDNDPKPSVSENDPKPSVSENDPKPSVSGNETTEPTKPADSKPGDKKPDNLPKDESKIDPNKLEKRKDLSILLVKGKAKTQTSVTLTWLKEKKADGYEVYWSYCDGKNNYKKLATIKKNKKRTYTHKKLKKTREYKYFVASYRMVSGRKVYISKSPNVHVAMSFDKRTNVKKIKTNKTKVTLAVKNKKYKKSFAIKAKMTLENKKKKALQHVRVLRYYTSDKSVAKVSNKGVITAKGKGKCTIYVIANNGAYKKIKVTVK